MTTITKKRLINSLLAIAIWDAIIIGLQQADVIFFSKSINGVIMYFLGVLITATALSDYSSKLFFWNIKNFHDFFGLSFVSFLLYSFASFPILLLLHIIFDIG